MCHFRTSYQGVENPADLASRGVNPLSLASNALLCQEEAREMEDVSEIIQQPPECMKEIRVQAVRDLEESATLHVTNTPEVGIAHVINFEHYSDFFKL